MLGPDSSQSVAKCLRGVGGNGRYRGGVSKFLGFLLGIVVALAGPAVFGVLAAPGGIELNAKGMALAYGIGALIFWTVVSYFSGAGALGAFVAFGTLVYCWHWIPNRTTNFLNDVPGVTTGMMDGSREYTLTGVVPILTVISLIFGIQLIVQSVQRRRRDRAEAERLQREQEAAQAQQEAEAAAVYPVAGGTYPAAGSQYGGAFENSSRYGDLFDDEDVTPVPPRNQADEQTAQLPTSDAQGNEAPDETVTVPTDRDDTTQIPAPEPQQPEAQQPEPQQPEATQPEPQQEKKNSTEEGQQATVAAAAPEVKEQVGQQYRERMEDPEDTGEFHVSAFENPPPVINGPGQFRPAGA